MIQGPHSLSHSAPIPHNLQTKARTHPTNDTVTMQQQQATPACLLLLLIMMMMMAVMVNCSTLSTHAAPASSNRRVSAACSEDEYMEFSQESNQWVCVPFDCSAKYGTAKPVFNPEVGGARARAWRKDSAGHSPGVACIPLHHNRQGFANMSPCPQMMTAATTTTITSSSSSRMTHQLRKTSSRTIRPLPQVTEAAAAAVVQAAMEAALRTCLMYVKEAVPTLPLPCSHAHLAPP